MKDMAKHCANSGIRLFVVWPPVTLYHLNAEGTLLRTRKLVSLLKPILAQSKNVSMVAEPASVNQ
jgi:hypothetical protein